MQIKYEGKTAVIAVEKEVMQEDVDTLQRTLLEAMDNGARNVVLDLSDCSYITSMGLSVIFHVKKKFNEQGGDIRIARINVLIKNLFEMTNLNKTIDLFDSVEEALRSYT